MTDRKTLKLRAREAMREAKPHPFWVTLAVAAILAVLMGLSMYIGGSFETYRELFRMIASGELLPGFVSGAEIQVSSEGTSGFGSFLVLALELMASVISVGYILYCLRVSRRIKASVGDVFDVFGMFLRALIVRVMRSVLMFLWGMVFAMAVSVVLTVVLLITMPTGSPEEILAVLNAPWLLAVIALFVYVPMIVASYFYRLAEFFMLDNPGMSAFQSLSMSRMAMRGRKWELFKLDLSFIGWYLLSVVPFVGLWVEAYTTITTAGFYDAVSPLFMQELEQKLRERQEARQRPFDSRGYHVPGQKTDDEDDTTE